MKMGQRLFFPPSVAGWPGGLAWLGGQAVVARANFAAWITDHSNQGRVDHPRRLAETYGLKTPAAWLAALATLWLGPPLSAAGRSLCEHQFPDHLPIMRQLLSLDEAQIG